MPFRYYYGVYTIQTPDAEASVNQFTMDSSLDKPYSNIKPGDATVQFAEEMEEKIKFVYTVAKELAEQTWLELAAIKAKKFIAKTMLQKKIHPDTNKPQSNGSSEKQKPEEIDNITETKLKDMGFSKNHMSVSIETVRFANTKNDEDCRTKETIVKRQVEYVGIACFEDIFTKKLKEASFRIIREDLKYNKKTKTFKNKPDKDGNRYTELVKTEGEENAPWKKEFLSTNQFQCISWKDTIEHDNFDRQIYFPRKMYFTSKELDLYGEALIAISPWHNQFQFYQDITKLDPEAVRTEPSGIEYPRLVIPQFKSVNFFPSAIIDNLLNINMKYNTRFLFQPIITRPDSLAWGKLPRSRELIRDGYYLLRILIVRNPQETGSTPTVELVSEAEKDKETIVNTTRQLQLNDLEYISHTDTVVKVQANFVNPYIPIEFTTQQLLYLASRNLVIIQMAPADPAGYEFVQEGIKACHVDEKKTDWIAYTDHDLITFPYAGPINIQNWTNWNILQEGCNRDESGRIIECLETDKIIKQSEEGKKHRYFDLDPVMDISICNDHPDETHAACDRVKERNSEDQKEEATGKGNPEVSPAVGGSDDCLKFLKWLNEKDENRTEILEDNEGTWQTPRNNIPMLGSKECVNDENCQRLVIRIDEQKIFKEYGCDEYEFFKPFTGVCFNSGNDKTVKIQGLGTRECINEDEITDEDKNDLQLTQNPETPSIEELLEDFSRANSLVAVDLFNEKTLKKFLQDINNQAQEIDQYARQMINEENFVFTPLNTFVFVQDLLKGMYSPTEMKEFLPVWDEIDTTCREKYLSHLDESTDPKSWSEFYQPCAISVFRDHLRKRIANIDKKQVDDSESSTNVSAQAEAIRTEREKLEELFYLLSSEENFQEKLIRLTTQEVSKDTLFNIVNDGIEKEKRISQGSFIHSLCSFWFNSYFKDYLKEEQMANAFTNSIRRLDYRLILDSDMFQDESGQKDADKLLGDLLSVIPSEGKLTECSESYHSCVMRDYCQTDRGAYTGGQPSCQNYKSLIGKNNSCQKFNTNHRWCQSCTELINQKCQGDNKNDLCEKKSNLITNEEQCKEGVESYCKTNSKDPLCSLYEENDLCEKKLNSITNEEQCRGFVKSHCEINSKDPLCSLYSDRCTINYLACSESQENFTKAREEFWEHFQEKKSQVLRSQVPLSQVSRDRVLGNNYPSRYEDSIFDSHPIKTCLKNPYEFFSFSNKMIVEDLSDVRFQKGLMQHFSLNGSFSVGSYLNWTSERRSGIGFKLGVEIKAGTPKLFSFLTLGMSLGADANTSISSGESNSVRRALDTRFANSVFMVASEALIEMDVTKFRKCLVIKPRANALTVKYENGLPYLYDKEGEEAEWNESNVWPQSFHRRSFKKLALAHPGLVLCNPPKQKSPKNPETITEKYYYISQSNVRTDTAHILNLYDIRNRPFVVVLRGEEEFLKYMNLLRQTVEGHDKDTGETSSVNEAPINMFPHYPHPVENLAGYSLSMRMLGDTGFQPGIYTYPPSKDRLDVLIEREKQGLWSKALKAVERYSQESMFDVPPPSSSPAAVNSASD